MPKIIRHLKSAVNRFLAVLAFSCHDMSRLSSQAMDTRLPRMTRFRMRVHYLICAWCRRYRAQLALLRRAVSRLGNDAPEAGPALSPEARERIKKHLCTHEDGGGH